jgi:hypothetical protein
MYFGTQAGSWEWLKRQWKPPSLKVGFSKICLFSEYRFLMNEPDVNPYFFTDNFAGAYQYGISGNWRWTPPANRAEWHLLFRLSSTPSYSFGNMNALGDRTLAVWVHSSNFLHFATYNYDLTSNVNEYANVNFDYQEFNNKWFFLYFGYSRE